MEILRTLVVDDELGMRLSIKKAITKHKLTLADVEDEIGFEVEIAETGEEALDKIEAQKPDILLLDYKLPGISGLEVLEKIASQESEMITIMITAYASIETAVTAVKSGAFDFIAKPFTPAELKATVNKAAQSLILARQVKKLAHEKRQVRFQFISVLGHELKSPLNAIDGYLDIMKKRTIGADISAYDSMLDRSQIRLNSMRKLIIDLLDLTRIESGQKKRELKQLNIQKIAELAVETALPAAKEKNISISLKSSEPILMNCDSGEIEIIFNNLISNAVKYNRQNGNVEVKLDKKNHEVIISVKDNGICMTSEETSRLFNEFVRIKNEKTKNIQGSGLGLTIVKKIALLYNGDVSVTSKPDKGSAFTVKLLTD
ncbi:MAG: response regulator [Bacteroidales bacterium]|nr:response regulator [Bacteroidales bacterium]